MEPSTVYFIIIVVLLAVQLILVLSYSKPAVVIKQQNNNYLKRNAVRNNKINKVNTSMRPVRPEIARVYLQSYENDTLGKKTKGLEIDIETVAFFYNYLLNNPSKNLALGFARFDKKLLEQSGLKDPDLDANPTKDLKYTLMIGCCDKGGKRADPFQGIGILEGGFYDDWNQEWP